MNNRDAGALDPVDWHRVRLLSEAPRRSFRISTYFRLWLVLLVIQRIDQVFHLVLVCFLVLLLLPLSQIIWVFISKLDHLLFKIELLCELVHQVRAFGFLFLYHALEEIIGILSNWLRHHVFRGVLHVHRLIWIVCLQMVDVTFDLSTFRDIRHVALRLAFLLVWHSQVTTAVMHGWF